MRKKKLCSDISRVVKRTVDILNTRKLLFFFLLIETFEVKFSEIVEFNYAEGANKQKVVEVIETFLSRKRKYI